MDDTAVQAQSLSFSFTHIYAADETAVWIDPSGGKCIDERGAKEVRLDKCMR